MIYTIGYEGLTPGEFTDILQAHSIDILIDVRDLPLSRKKGFSKNALAEAMQGVGIEYVHLRELGAPRDIRHALRASNDWDVYRHAYLELLHEKQQVLAQVEYLSSNRRICLMCFEEDFSVCHRSLISEKMQQLGMVLKVKHLHFRKEKVVLVEAAK